MTNVELIPVPENLQFVTMVSDEVTALCPRSGQPDWYQVSIRYRPKQWLIESKSLKFYLQSFRQVGIMAESLADRIYRELREQVGPEWMEVTITQKSRGGITIVATAGGEG